MILRRALLVLFVFAPAASSQTTTATLVGRVTLRGDALAGVTVSVSSAALQGIRSTATAADGTYTLPALPPGDYTVRFVLQGLPEAVRTTALHVAQTSRIDAELQPARLAQEITVVPGAQSVLSDTQVSTNLNAQMIESLPIGRGILDTIRLAPGVSNSAPGQRVTINGAEAYDNLYLVDGVTVNEQTFGQPQNLYIEDAIQETTVLSAGVSAEYGRFTGGVVNVITKSGGNEMAGSLRDGITSDRWTSATPFANEPAHLRDINNDYEATLGGRIVRDRLWFFVAGRYGKRDNALSTQLTNVPYRHSVDDRRREIKLTGNVTANQSVVASYIRDHSLEDNVRGNLSADLRSLAGTDEPNAITAIHYTGLFRGSTVIEAQYHRKHDNVRNTGPLGTDLLNDTQVTDDESGAIAWAPFLCGCGRNDRDNHDALFMASAFVSTRRTGSHELVAGVEDFHELRHDSAHQSPTDFVVHGVLTPAGNNVALSVVPDESYIEWDPILFPSEGADYATRSAFFNDRISFGTHWTWNAGVRWDGNTARDQLGLREAHDSRVSPRLAAMYDVTGSGRSRLSATFGRYASKVDQGIGLFISPAGFPAIYYFSYEGEPINENGALTTDEVLRRVFDWFNSVGGTSNTDLLQTKAFVAGQTLGRGLQAPIMDEVTVGYGQQLGSHGAMRVDYIRRHWSDFYTERATLGTGSIVDAVGNEIDRIVVENGNAGLKRDYHGVLLQGTARVKQLSAGGNATWSRLVGNVESLGGSGTVPVPLPHAYYPEYTDFPQYAPVGYLNSDVRLRANLWAAFEHTAGRAQFVGTVLETYHSPLSYNATIPLTLTSIKTAYLDPPSFLVPYYLYPRGSLRVDSIRATGVGLNVSWPVAATQLYTEADIQNVFDRHGVEFPLVNRSITTAGLKAFNPFSGAAPVECPQGVSRTSAQCKGIANYQLAAAFGQPTSAAAYQQPRTYRFAIGMRF